MKPVLTLSEAFELYRKDVIVYTNQSAKTEEMNRCAMKSIINFLGDIPVTELDFDAVRKWSADLRRTRTSNTVRGYILKIRVVLKHLRALGYEGILDPEDAKDAVRFGADGIIVSNHGGRQLDGVLSSAKALPSIADAVKGEIKILADSGIRNGLDVVRMLALGADCTMIGRSFVYALSAAGQAGVENVLDIFLKEMKVAMTLTSNAKISDITRDALVDLTKI